MIPSGLTVREEHKDKRIKEVSINVVLRWMNKWNSFKLQSIWKKEVETNTYYISLGL